MSTPLKLADYVAARTDLGDEALAEAARQEPRPTARRLSTIPIESSD